MAKFKLPTVFVPITPRGTIAFDAGGDPMVFTKPWLAIKACGVDETVHAFTLTPAVSTTPVVSEICSPYAD